MQISIFLCISISVFVSFSPFYSKISAPFLSKISVSIFLDFETCYKGVGILMLDFCQGLWVHPQAETRHLTILLYTHINWCLPRGSREQ